MTLKYEAILSLNTRVRRLRYLYKILDWVFEAPVTYERLAQRLLDYGVSAEVYNEVAKSAKEPYSGHFFEDVSWGYDRNIEKRATRRHSNFKRVAEAYIKLGACLRLLVENDRRISASQLSFPLRFFSACSFLSIASEAQLRDRYILSLLATFDRDLMCPVLLQLLRSRGGVTITDVENEWDSWTNEWLHDVIDAASRSNLANPSRLVRQVLTTKKLRTNPRRYAEHTALIRFHWLIDLDIAIGSPARNPTNFAIGSDLWRNLTSLLDKIPGYLVLGDLAQTYFYVCKATVVGNKAAVSDFAIFLDRFLFIAGARGMANIRLNLIDIAWCGLSALMSTLPDDYNEFCTDVDKRLKARGISVIRAPAREETYVATTGDE